MTASAIDPTSPPSGPTRVFVWGRENFLAASIDDAEGRKATDLYLWRYSVSASGTISVPEYWSGSGFTTNINQAVRLFQQINHVIVGQQSVFWAAPINKWVMIYGGRLPFVEPVEAGPQGLLPSLSPAQVFDPSAGIYVSEADNPQGPWSVPRTIFNPFWSTFGYCEIMYFSDAFQFLEQNHKAFFDGIYKECPEDGATRTAQKWWQARTLPLDQDPDKLRNAFGAEYGAAVLPQFIEATSVGGVRFQWLLSTWNPYRVVVMETELGPGP